MKQILKVPQPAKAGQDRAKRTVSVYCLASSSFEMEVNSAETGWEVTERIAAGVDHPAGLLVLCCHRWLCHRSVPAAAASGRKLGAGRVAMLWERLFEDKTLSDVAALNETMSLTWCSNLPGHPISQQPAEFDVWI